MIENKQQKVKALKSEIKACRSWRSFCNIFGFLVIALVPLSVLFGNKTLALCAISWIVGSFFTLVSSAVELKSSELENEICGIELSDQLRTTSGNPAPQSAETYFGPISMN